MKCLSEIYNIYLVDNNTLLFYDTMKKGELDKVNVEIKNAPKILIELVELMSDKTQDEIYKIVCSGRKIVLPDVVKAILYHMLWGIELEESDIK